MKRKYILVLIFALAIITGLTLYLHRVWALISSGRLYPEPDLTGNFLFNQLMAIVLLIVALLLLLKMKPKINRLLSKLISLLVIVGFLSFSVFMNYRYVREAPSLVRVFETTTGFHQKEYDLDEFDGHYGYFLAKLAKSKSNVWVINYPLSIDEILAARKAMLKRKEDEKNNDTKHAAMREKNIQIDKERLAHWDTLMQRPFVKVLMYPSIIQSDGANQLTLKKYDSLKENSLLDFLVSSDVVEERTNYDAFTGSYKEVLPIVLLFPEAPTSAEKEQIYQNVIERFKQKLFLK